MNSFENLYGYLYRSYTKAIITSINAIDKFEKIELSTIGVLQYHPIDNSFYYAPTLKNVLINPGEIIAPQFPTTKEKLWNHELMISLGKYLSASKCRRWIEELIQENITLESERGSIYSVTYKNYSQLRIDWLEWFKSNIGLISKIKPERNISEKDKILLNKLFYFANYLITIVKRPAFINKLKKKLSNAESIFLCINNREICKYVGPTFDKNKAELNKGIHIQWEAIPDTQEYKAELIFILEVCLKQPFDVAVKKRLIQQVIDKNLKSKPYSINATGIPLLHNGEFLGISYVAWPSSKKKSSLAMYEDIEPRIKKVLRDSRFSSFLYKARFTTARFHLIEFKSPKTVQKTTLERIFELSHVYSSAHLVAFIDEDGLVRFRFLRKEASEQKIKEFESKRTGQQLLLFLKSNLKNFQRFVGSKELESWIDVATETIRRNEEDLIKKAFHEIQEFNQKLKEFIDDEEFKRNDYFNITNLTIHLFKNGKGGKRRILIFFNSNYRIIYNYVSDIVKQSYSREFHNNLNELIEDENVHRFIYKQSQTFQEEMKKGFFHYVKSFLHFKFKYIIGAPLPMREKLNYIDQNCNILIDRMNSFLRIYNMSVKGKETELGTIINLWNWKKEEYSSIKNLKIIESELPPVSNIEFKGCPDSIHMIMDEFISNAIKATKFENNPKIELGFDYEIHEHNITLTLKNSGSTIETNQRDKLGITQISDSHSAGLGFTICELLLDRMGAQVFDNKHFILSFYDQEESFTCSFRVQKSIK